MNQSFLQFPNEILIKVLRHLPLENLCEIVKIAPVLKDLINYILFENIVIVIKDSDKWNPFRMRINGFTFTHDFSASRNICLVFLSDLHKLHTIDKRWVKSVTIKCNDYLNKHLISAEHVELHCIGTLSGTSNLDTISEFVSAVPNLQVFENYCPYINLPINKISARCFTIHAKSQNVVKFNESVAERLDVKFYRPQMESVDFTRFNLRNLKSLSIEHSIRHFNGCDLQLPFLELLSLRNNRISSYQNLTSKYLPSLVELDLSNNYIDFLVEPISFPNLKSLDLSDNKIYRIKNLLELPRLETLNLDSNKITMIENLESCLHLRCLQLNNNNIASIGGLEHLHNLQVLDLSYNQIENLNWKLPLPNNLTELYLRSNCIDKLERLENCHWLKTLVLTNNHIAKLCNLDHCERLESLVLDFNELIRIENLESMARLKHLNLSGNKIHKIENLNHMDNLVELNLNNNNIRTVENLDNLHCLKTLYLYHNNCINKLDHTMNIDYYHTGQGKRVSAYTSARCF